MKCEQCGSEQTKKNGKDRGLQQYLCKNCGHSWRIEIEDNPTPKPQEKRSRNWNAIIYPESAPTNWRDIIDTHHIEWVESPLHDQDVNDTATDENADRAAKLKKPHYHITLLYPTDKSFSQVKELLDACNSPRPERCNSVKGSIRYMTHRDHPDKAQYAWSDIKTHGGADLDNLCAPTHAERLEIQKDILRYIKEHTITEFQTIVDYTIEHGLDHWCDIILNYNTIGINTYIRSLRHAIDRGTYKPPNTVTTDRVEVEVVDQATGLVRIFNTETGEYIETYAPKTPESFFQDEK